MQRSKFTLNSQISCTAVLNSSVNFFLLRYVCVCICYTIIASLDLLLDLLHLLVLDLDLDHQIA